MVNFFRNCSKVKSGLPLYKKEIENIWSYFKFNISPKILLGTLISALTISLGIYINIYWSNLIVLYILFYVLGGLIFLYYVPIFRHYFRKSYFKALESFYDKYLAQYSFDKIFYTNFETSSITDINKEVVYFLTDDYYFYIVEDIFIHEDVSLITKNITFNVPDVKSLNKYNLSFKLSDIISFKLNDDICNYVPNNKYDILYKKIAKKKLCKITLKDFKVISIGEDVGCYFRKLIPEREIY